MSLQLDEQRKSISNSKSEVLDAVILSNFGDPGLKESYHFDLLSRFLIVFISSAYRIPTEEKYAGMIACVARPKQLWVDVEEGKAASPNTQKRSDALGNISVGLPDSYTVAGIPQINFPYSIGDSIKIKRLSSPLKFGESTFFNSAFNETDQSLGQLTYGAWHTEGSTLPYFAGHQDRIDALRTKNIFTEEASPSSYYLTLQKYQYEALAMSIAATNSDMTSYMGKLFQNELPNGSPEYNAQGGYLFNGINKDNFINFTSIEFEDLNVLGRSRVSTSDCLPLIVCQPDSFKTPKVRQTSIFSYNPSLIIR